MLTEIGQKPERVRGAPLSPSDGIGEEEKGWRRIRRMKRQTRRSSRMWYWKS